MLEYFTDAVLRGPTIGCMLMCFAAALMGVIVFLRKKSLLGESLSHATYPGVNLGVILAGALAISDQNDLMISLFIMAGAFSSGLIGLWLIHLLERKFKIRSDSCLCFILSIFFGIGLTIASVIQFSHASLYRQIQVYLFGQAATMTDIHIFVYGILSLIVLSTVLIFYKEIEVLIFDRNYAKSIGIPIRTIDTILFCLITLALVIGIRSVGVVLMSAMLIAPSAAARQYTNKLYMMLIIASLFGLLSGYFGNYFSVQVTHYLAFHYPGSRLSVPTGPMIVLVASAICLLSLLFAPERGLFLRLIRIARFRYLCNSENLLKTMWRLGSQDIDFEKIEKYQGLSKFYLRFILWRLFKNGWIEESGTGKYRLSAKGQHKAAKIVRLHKLWEVYLVDYLGIGAEKAHRNVEEMEYIITPELEKELMLLIKDAKIDPCQEQVQQNG